MDHQTFAQLLGSYGEFVAAIAVVATLIYPLVEDEWLRTKSMYTDEYIELVDSIVDEQH